MTGLETLLLGTGLSATTAGTATAGLLGSGGLLFGVEGLTASAIGSALGGISALSSVMGGMQQQTEAENQANQVMASATMAGRESARQAVAESGREKEAADKTRRAQKLAYLSSGVSLDGSPLLMMEKTRQTGLDNVDEILSSGASASTSTMAEGRIKASSLKAQGRQAFMSGIGSGVSSLLR